MLFGNADQEVTLYSQLTGKPFKVKIDRYPYGELPRLPESEFKKAHKSEMGRALLSAEACRASRKLMFFEGMKKNGNGASRAFINRCMAAFFPSRSGETVDIIVDLLNPELAAERERIGGGSSN